MNRLRLFAIAVLTATVGMAQVVEESAPRPQSGAAITVRGRVGNIQVLDHRNAAERERVSKVTHVNPEAEANVPLAKMNPPASALSFKGRGREANILLVDHRVAGGQAVEVEAQPVNTMLPGTVKAHEGLQIREEDAAAAGVQPGAEQQAPGEAPAEGAEAAPAEAAPEGGDGAAPEEEKIDLQAGIKELESRGFSTFRKSENDPVPELVFDPNQMQYVKTEDAIRALKAPEPPGPRTEPEKRY